MKKVYNDEPGCDPTIKRVSCIIVNAKSIDFIEKRVIFYTDGL